MKLLKSILLTLFLALSFATALGQATQLTGTLDNPDGSGFTGTLYLSLSQVAGVSPNNGCGGPVQVVPTATLIISVQSGTMASYTVQGNSTVITGAPKVYGSDCTLPVGVPYVAVARDLQNNLIFNQLWLLVGSTQDIGTVTANAANPQDVYLSIIIGLGSPTGICSNTQQYNQADATGGQNIWSCINGTWIQQGTAGGGGGGGMAIGNPVTGGTAGSALFLDGSGNLAQDNANYSYSVSSHTLSLLNLTLTNAMTGSVTGNAGTATLAVNSTNIGGVGLSGLCQTGGTGCPAGLAAGGSTGAIQAKAASGGLQASDLSDNFGVLITSTVPIVLPSDPTTNLQAATKQYVDAAVAGAAGAIVSAPIGNQTITQPDGTTLAINNAGITTGVTVSLGAHVNLAILGGTIAVTSPDTLSTLTFGNTGFAMNPSTNGYITLNGRDLLSFTTLTTSTTIGAAGEFVDYVNATSGALTETLPAANASTTFGQTYLITKTDSSSHAVTVAAGAGDTINGAATQTLGGQYASITLVSNGVHTWTMLSTTQSIASGMEFQTNSTNNSNQSLLNLTNGPGIVITEQNGKIVFTNTYAQNPTPPGIYQGVDWPPSIINAMNDEFTDSVFNTSNIWTVVNQGSDTVVNTNSLLSVGAVAHSGDNFVGIYQLTPSTPYAVTAKIVLTGMQVTGYYGGLAFRDSATGKVVSMRMNNGSSLTVDHWTNPTTLASSVFTQAVDASSTFYITLKDDGTNFTFYFSRDGVNFVQVYQESRTAFLASPGQVGYIAGSSNATWPMTLGSDWFRRTL